MYDTILVPYDGSDEGRKGAVHGIELAAALGADIHALYVIDLPGAPRALSTGALPRPVTALDTNEAASDATTSRDDG